MGSFCLRHYLRAATAGSPGEKQERNSATMCQPDMRLALTHFGVSVILRSRSPECNEGAATKNLLSASLDSSPSAQNDKTKVGKNQDMRGMRFTQDSLVCFKQPPFATHEFAVSKK